MISGTSKNYNIHESVHDGKLNQILQEVKTKMEKRHRNFWEKYLGKITIATTTTMKEPDKLGEISDHEIGLTLNRGERKRRFGGNVSDFLVIFNCFGNLGVSEERLVT